MTRPSQTRRVGDAVANCHDSIAPLKNFFARLGPGFISGASDDDPTAIAAYTQAGAQFGYTQLWTALFTTPLMTVVAEMSGRIGMVTGKGLVGVVKTHHHSKVLLYGAIALLLLSNIINIGADLGAMAASAQMLVGLPFVFWLLGITALTLVLEVFVSYRAYATFLKYLALVLLSYVATAFLERQDWSTIVHATFIPAISFDKAFLLNLAAILGTNLSPYLFFWQASEEVEEEVARHRIPAMGRGVPELNPLDFRHLRTDTALGMIFSNAVCFFIAIAAASTLGAHGLTDIQTPQQAAFALRPFAGQLSYVLFTVGIIGSGLLAVPVLAGSASYALSEALGWREGLYRKFRCAPGFYGAIMVATLISILIDFSSVGAIQMLVYSAAFNALLAPPLLVLILFISNNQEIMGAHTNSRLSNVLGVLTVVCMAGTSLALLVTLI
jgi:NRAMP (natural resistance-associated macrophage protein)-like metal ion transporter